MLVDQFHWGRIFGEKQRSRVQRGKKEEKRRGGKEKGERKLDETETQAQIRSGHQDKPSGARCRVN